MKALVNNFINLEVPIGNVYIMSHSLFSNIVRIGCTPANIEEYAKLLSAQSPGDYHIIYSSSCDNPCTVKNRIRHSLRENIYMNEFYELSTSKAITVVKREIMRIPSKDIH